MTDVKLTPADREAVAAWRDLKQTGHWPNVRALHGALRAILNEKDAEIEHWKAQHADEVRRKRVGQGEHRKARQEIRQLKASLSDSDRELDKALEEIGQQKAMVKELQDLGFVDVCDAAERDAYKDERDEVVALLRQMAQRAGDLWRGMDRDMLDAESSDANLADVELGELLTKTDALLARIDGANEGHALVETMGHIDGMDAELPTVQEIQVVDDEADTDEMTEHYDQVVGLEGAGEGNPVRGREATTNSETSPAPYQEPWARYNKHNDTVSMHFADGTTVDYAPMRDTTESEGAGEDGRKSRTEVGTAQAEDALPTPAPTLALPLSVGEIEAQRGNPVIWLEDAEGFRFPAIAHTEKNYARLFDIVEAVNGWFAQSAEMEGNFLTRDATLVNAIAPAPDLALPWRVANRDQQWPVVQDATGRVVCRPPSIEVADAIVEAVNGWHEA